MRCADVSLKLIDSTVLCWPVLFTIPFSPPAPEGYISRAEYMQVASSSYELLVAACDLAHVRCAKLLGVRTKVSCRVFLFVYIFETLQ